MNDGVKKDKIILLHSKCMGKKVPPADFWRGCQGGWKKHPENPVLGKELGTCFDISVLFENGRYRMWFSWRPKEAIALTESLDGFHWGVPQIVIKPSDGLKTESRVNRPCVVYHANEYHMWYTEQSAKHSWINYATSPTGIQWTTKHPIPVIKGDLRWEKQVVMCPSVIWDEDSNQYRMWYSGGGQYEPVAIGYAASLDGVHWQKSPKPVLNPAKDYVWEQDRVTACHVIRYKAQFLMFYIGFRDIDHAAIGMARSADGVSNWQRHPQNPIISPDRDSWDHDAVYKPYVIWNGSQWMLWYNGRHAQLEQIGVAIHSTEDFGF